MESAKPADLLTSKEYSALRIQALIAEYTALTNRISLWISLQYSIYGFGAVSLGAVVGALGRIDPLHLAWASTLLVLFMSWTYSQTDFEIWSTVRYLQIMREELMSLKHPTTLWASVPFWGWETFLVELRKRKFLSFEQKLGGGLIPILVIGVCVAGRNIYLCNWRIHLASSVLLFVFSAYVTIMACLKFREARHLLKKIEQSSAGEPVPRV